MDMFNVFEFLERIIELIKQENILQPNFNEKVINYVDPNKLKNKFDLSLSQACENLDDLEDLCRNIVKYSVKTNSKKFHNQLYGGTDLFGLGATWLSESLNTNQTTFEVAPVFSLIEQTVIDKVKDLVGYTSSGNGLFSPGGSISNMYGIVLARYQKFPQIKTKGLFGLPILVAYTSEDASSLKRNAVGIGYNVTYKTAYSCRPEIVNLRTEFWGNDVTSRTI